MHQHVLAQSLKALISRDLEVAGTCSLSRLSEISSSWEESVSFMIHHSHQDTTNSIDE